MPATAQVAVRIDLQRIRANAEALRREAGVPLIAVVKADAYGLGARQIVPALADLVEGFCLFSVTEAAALDCWRLSGRPSLTLAPPGEADPLVCRELHIRPAVSSPREAARFAPADPVLSVDTGQQRFACPPEAVEEALRQGCCREAMTHATRPEQVQQFLQFVGGRGLRLHAVSSSLLHLPEARLDAVRPGVALYRGAARVSTRLVDVRDSRGPAGYTGFTVSRHGVILCGFSNGLRVGPCLINGRPQRILEVGMQSAFVECAADDRVGDEVVMLGDGVTEERVAQAWGVTPQTALLHLTSSGERTY